MRSKREQAAIDGFMEFLWGVAIYTLMLMIVMIILGVLFYLGQCWVRWEWVKYSVDQWREIRVAYLMALGGSFILAMIMSANLEKQ